jgi:hypothetical protein
VLLLLSPLPPHEAVVNASRLSIKFHRRFLIVHSLRPSNRPPHSITASFIRVERPSSLDGSDANARFAGNANHRAVDATCASGVRGGRCFATFRGATQAAIRGMDLRGER